MNYKKLYDSIIFKRQKYPAKTGYTEKHHILPKSLGGIDSENNLVSLTAREHFICHYLLAKIYDKYTFEWYKMNHAFMMMKTQSFDHNRYFNSRLYNSMKTNFSITMSYSQSGEKNSQYGKIWIYNSQLKLSKKIREAHLITWKKKGWKRGRIVNWDLYSMESDILEEQKIRLHKIKKGIKILQKMKRLKAEGVFYNKLFKKYLNSSYNSMREFVREGHYDKSHVTLTKKFKKFIKNYNNIIKPFTTKKLMRGGQIVSR